MEKIFAELLGRLLEPGAGASLITVVFLVVAYFKFLKPYLVDFEFIKNFLKSIPEVHEEYDDKLTKIQVTLENLTEIEILKIEELSKDFMNKNTREHDKLVVEFGKIRYLIEEVVRKSEKISDRDLSTLNEIILEISKLQSKVEYINIGGLGGIQK